MMDKEKEQLLEFLENASGGEPVAGAIEHVCEGGHLSSRAASAIARFTRSSDVDTRYEAMLALVHYAKRTDLDAEAIALLISGLIRDDSDACFGAVAMLGMMAAAGNSRASELIELLRLDEKVRESLQLA
jgi:phytoene/squalene synthetase